MPWIVRWYTSGADLMPNGSLLNLYLPNGVAKVQSWEELGVNFSCQNPDFASSFDSTLAPANCAITSTREGSLKRSLLMALFRFRGSRHTLRFPSFLCTTTSPLIHSLGSFTFSITSHFSILSSSTLRLSFNANGTFLHGSTTGVTFLSNIIQCSPGRHPNPSNKSGNSANKALDEVTQVTPVPCSGNLVLSMLHLTPLSCVSRPMFPSTLQSWNSGSPNTAHTRLTGFNRSQSLTANMGWTCAGVTINETLYIRPLCVICKTHCPLTGTSEPA